MMPIHIIVYNKIIKHLIRCTLIKRKLEDLSNLGWSTWWSAQRNIQIHATVVWPSDHESTVRVLVSTLNSGVMVIESAEEIAEMILVPFLTPSLEELGKIYWTLPITKRFREYSDERDEDGPGSSKSRPCYDRARDLSGLVKSSL